MGQELVNGAILQYPSLPHATRMLLVTMALYAKDRERRPRSYLGQQNLCTALGYDPSPGSARNVRKHLQALIDAGAITRTRTGGRSRQDGAWRSEFTLNVQPVPLKDGLAPTGSNRPAPTGSNRPAPTGSNRPAPTGSNRPARPSQETYTSDLHKRPRGETSSSSSPSVGLRWADE